MQFGSDDYEGLHVHLNRKEVSRILGKYKLSDIPHHEASIVDIKTRLLFESKITRFQTKSATGVQSKQLAIAVVEQVRSWFEVGLLAYSIVHSLEKPSV